MSEIEIIAVRKFPNQPDIPEQLVAELDEQEMRICFLQELKTAMFDRKKKLLKPQKLTKEEHIQMATKAYDAMMKVVKIRTRVRVRP